MVFQYNNTVIFPSCPLYSSLSFFKEHPTTVKLVCILFKTKLESSACQTKKQCCGTTKFLFFNDI